MNDTPVVILCGGRGTRFKEQTELKPKPMIDVAGKPILLHIMNLYADQGYHNFVLCLGYKAELIKRYFLDYAANQSDFTVDLSQPGRVTYHQSHMANWQVTCVDTGLDAMTGARLKRVSAHLKAQDFLLTYGDGLSDVDIRAAHAFHRTHGKLVTVTGVRPPSRFGELDVQGEVVQSFAEKPDVVHGHINGGFFVMKREFLTYVKDDDSCILERAPLTQAAADGQMRMFHHDGFWQCMDTARDLETLERAWNNGDAPWRKWQHQ